MTKKKKKSTMVRNIVGKAKSYGTKFTKKSKFEQIIRNRIYIYNYVKTQTSSLFGWGFTPYQRYFSYLTTTVHKSMFPALFLTGTKPVHYPDTGGPVVVLFP